MLNNHGHPIKTTVANNCKEAFEIISNPVLKTTFDFVLLDYSLPSYSERNINNGEDLGVMIREFMPKTKIIILTSLSAAVVLYNVHERVKPEGLIVKSDITATDLKDIFEKILGGQKYFSHTAKAATNNSLFEKGKLDAVDRQIIKYIAQGYQIKSIALKVMQTEDSIKKRKSKIHDILGVNEKGDEKLLEMFRILYLI